MINKTHSKKDLINIIHTFNIDLPDATDYNKKDLIFVLETELERNEDYQYEDNIYFIECKKDLLIYLKNPNINKIPIKEKDNIIKNSKEIIKFCKCNGNILCTYFDTLDNLKIIANNISYYGDIPTCRRAIKLLEPYYYVEIKMSNKTKMTLQKKEEDRIKNINKYQVNYGKFKISFT
tara:strand:- start:811 stop:1344 length:534 start_codon:yes stop_codon:yes gene_type:complete